MFVRSENISARENIIEGSIYRAEIKSEVENIVRDTVSFRIVFVGECHSRFVTSVVRKGIIVTFGDIVTIKNEHSLCANYVVR